MTEAESILAGVSSDDHASRLGAADWFEEHGRPHEAALLRDLAWPVAAAGGRVVRAACEAGRTPEGRQFWANVYGTGIRRGVVELPWVSPSARCLPGPPARASAPFEVWARCCRRGEALYHAEPLPRPPFEFLYHGGEGGYDPDGLMPVLPLHEIPEVFQRHIPLIAHPPRTLLVPGDRVRQRAGFSRGPVEVLHCPCGTSLPGDTLADRLDLVDVRRAFRIQEVFLRSRTVAWSVRSGTPPRVRDFAVAYLVGACDRCGVVWWAHGAAGVVSQEGHGR